MSMNEFVARFAAKDEKSFLFEVLRKVGRLDRGVMLDASTSGWVEWPPADDSAGVGSLRVAKA